MTWLEKLFVLSLWEPPDGCEVAFTVCPSRLEFQVLITAGPGVAILDGMFVPGYLDRAAAFAALDELAAEALADRDRQHRPDQRAVVDHLGPASAEFAAGIADVRRPKSSRAWLDRHEC